MINALKRSTIDICRPLAYNVFMCLHLLAQWTVDLRQDEDRRRKSIQLELIPELPNQL